MSSFYLETAKLEKQKWKNTSHFCSKCNIFDFWLSNGKFYNNILSGMTITINKSISRISKWQWDVVFNTWAIQMLYTKWVENSKLCDEYWVVQFIVHMVFSSMLSVYLRTFFVSKISIKDEYIRQRFPSLAQIKLPVQGITLHFIL